MLPDIASDTGVPALQKNKKPDLANGLSDLIILSLKTEARDLSGFGLRARINADFELEFVQTLKLHLAFDDRVNREVAA